MHLKSLNQIVFGIVATAVLTFGFVPPSHAGILTTEQLLAVEDRQAALTRIESTLLREDIAAQLVARGVDPASVMGRVDNLSTSELLELDGKINDQVAGSSALGTIGAVFLVLLILELVGITDIFKKI